MRSRTSPEGVTPTDTVLVAGGAGFIGSHVCKFLKAHGKVPVTIDNLSTGHKDNVRWGPLYDIDIRDTAATAAVIEEHQIDTVMHFAASAYVGESVTDPALYYDNNVGGMISLLNACRQTDVSKFIFSSSCATYGEPEKLPISEQTVQAPINPYGRTKYFCEKMLSDHDAAYGLPHVILRYFNACGADPDGELCERHTPETHLIPLILLAAAGKRDKVSIFGSDYDTPDGTCVRDYIHVDDLARGHFAALSYLETKKGNLSVNLGSGRGHSILEVIAAVEKVTGHTVPVTFEAKRAGDPPTLCADPQLAETALGFRTQASNLETIIKDAAPSFGLKIRDKSYV